MRNKYGANGSLNICNNASINGLPNREHKITTNLKYPSTKIWKKKYKKKYADMPGIHNKFEDSKI